MKTLTIILCLALAQCGLSPAWADTVELPDAPDPFSEPGGPDAADLAASAPIGDLAMLYHVPTAADVDIAENATTASPLLLQAATGSDTRLGVDLTAADAASRGWPWYGKAAVLVGCVLVAGLATWAIVEATQNGDHTSGDDSSTHYNIGVGGEGNSVHVRIDSPETSSTTTRGY